MASTSTVPTVKALLVTKFTTAVATASPSGGQVPVTYAWPGPETGYEAVFLGRHPELQELRMDVDSEIPTVKAGRKHRQESYAVDVTVWTFRPDLDAADAAEAEARAFAIFAELEDVLADDPTLGTSVVQQAVLRDYSSTLWPFQTGWACELTATVAVSARLT